MKVSDLAQFGQIKDQPGWQLPPNAWTTLFNIRVNKKQLATIDGYGEFGDTSAVPYYLLTASDDAYFRWIYPSTTSIYMTTDGTTHWDVTGTTPTGGSSDRWNGGVLNGLPILNNGVDQPQFMADLDVTTNFANLIGWDSNWRAKVIRVFRNFIFALYTTETSAIYPQKLRWSSSADAGAIPTAWTPAASNDAGYTSLSETPGTLIDMLELGDSAVIYKDDSAYLVQYIAGDAIFRFSRIKTAPGMLAQDCGCEFEGGHFVVSDGDVYVHDTQSKQSVIDDRNRDALFNAIDATNWNKTFVYHNKVQNEIWICYPAFGSTWCNAAYIWQYRDNVWYQRDLPSNTTFIAAGVVDAVALTWDTLPWSTWNNWQGQWGTARFSPVEDYPIAVTTASKMYQFSTGNQADGSNQYCYAERKGLNIGVMEQINLIKRIYPYAKGGQFSVYIGSQDSPNDAVMWQGPYSFDPTTDYKIDCRVNGRLHAIRFESNSNVVWSLNAYEFDAVQVGQR